MDSTRALIGRCLLPNRLRANVCKNRATSRFRGHSQKTIFANILSIDMHKEVTKRGVVCFSKGRLDLEKINKINFRGPRLEKQKKFEAKKGGLKTSLART